MPRNYTVEIDLRGNTKQLKTALKSAGKASKDLEKKVKKNNDAIKNSMRGLGLGFAALSGVKKAVTDVREFGKAASELSTLGIDDKELQDYTASARELAKTFGGDASGQISAYYQAVSAGAANFAEAQSVVATANKLAVGGVTDILTATDGLTSVLNAYSLSSEDASEISDVFFNTMKVGKTTVGELAKSIGKVAPITAGLGVSFAETGAAIAQITKGGISTSEAVTGLKAALSNVLKPTTAAKQIAEELGINFSAAGLEAKGLIPFIQEIAKATGGSTQQMAKFFGSIEGVNSVLALVKNGGDDFAETLDIIESGAGATDTAVEKVKDSLDFKMSQSTAQIKDLSISLGETLVPALEAVLPIIIKVVESIANFAKDNPTIAAALLGMAAIGGAVALMGGPITAIALAIAGAIIVFENWEEIVGWLKDAWNSLGERFPIVGKVISAAIDVVMAPINALIFAFESVIGLWDKFTGMGSIDASNITESQRSTYETDYKAGAGDGSKQDAAKRARYNTAKQVLGYEDGGAVLGAGTGTSDSIPAMLSNGEFVINAKSTKALGVGTLNTLNKYATGGIVGNTSSSILSKFATGGAVENNSSRTLHKYATGGAVENNISSILNKYAKGGAVKNSSIFNKYATGGPVGNTDSGGFSPDTTRILAALETMTADFSRGDLAETVDQFSGDLDMLEKVFNTFISDFSANDFAETLDKQVSKLSDVDISDALSESLLGFVNDYDVNDYEQPEVSTPMDYSVDTTRIFTALEEMTSNFSRGDLGETVDQFGDDLDMLETVFNEFIADFSANDFAEVLEKQVEELSDIEIADALNENLLQFVNDYEVVNDQLGEAVIRNIHAFEELSVAMASSEETVRNLGSSFDANLGEGAFASLRSTFQSSLANAFETGDFKGAVKNIFKNVASMFANRASEQLTGVLFGSKGGGGVGGFLSSILGFSDGGVVPGTGSMDTVPALLTPGEIVINPDKGQSMGGDTFNFNIEATDAQSFKNMLARDPQFLNTVVEQGKRATTGLRRTR